MTTKKAKTKKTEKFYITTAIDYVNAKPHVGHAYEKTLADTIARWNRLTGKDVYFITGVDENAQKNVEAAEKEGIPVKEFIDKNANFFVELCKKLNLSHNDFIRTTAKQHKEVVQKIINKILAKKDIYKGAYTGLYCVGCETYYTEKDLIDGKCPEHKTEPEKRTEDAYFFKLSKYKKEILKIVPKYVTPTKRANEIISRIKEDDLVDICISRKGAKWGIDFPIDKDFKIWVWIDALINYISGLKDKEKTYWPANLHVIGKGINWFHSVIWPAMLISAGYRLPEKLLVHGYLNISGEKVSKSLGNVIDPLNLLNKYSSDTVRYSFLKCSTFDDTEYSEEILINRNNNELANKLGNLVSRVSALVETHGLEKTKTLDIKKLKKDTALHLDNYEFDKALNEIFAFIDKCNAYVQEKKPWETHDKKVLYLLSNAIKDIAILLSPFIPETAEHIAKTFNFDISLKSLDSPLKISKIKKAPILFKKIEILSVDTPKTINVNNNKQNINKTRSIEGIMSTLQFSDWEKVDLRVGKIESAEDIPSADKLYKLTVNIGTETKTICAGIKKHYSKEQLINKKVIVIINLAPRMMKGIESQGMLLAAVSADESQVILLTPDKDIKEGSKVR